jgi:hypothetical protein
VTCRGRPVNEGGDAERLAHLSRLLDPNVSLGRAYHGMNQRRRDGEAQTRIEALMLSLRSRGVQALGEPDALRRLGDLNHSQLRRVAVRLQKLTPEIARAWQPEDIEVLIAARRRLK